MAEKKKHHRGPRKEKIYFDDFYDEFEFERAIFTALKDAREKQCLSQRQLAEKIGITQAALARFEAGNSNPTLTFIKKIVLGLNLQIIIKPMV